MQENFDKFEEIIGYSFENKETLKKALTHSSFSNENKLNGNIVQCNERLEFLGDSVLSLIASVYLLAVWIFYHILLKNATKNCRLRKTFGSRQRFIRFRRYA